MCGCPVTLWSNHLKDELTGLLNPAAFRLLVEHELVVARRLGRVDTLLVIDVDGLRAINESFGNEGGDETLRSIGRLLQRTARESDIIARIGGDEFAIFALDCVGDGLASRIAAAVLRSPPATVQASNIQVSVKIKIGITEVLPGEEYDELITRAGPAALVAAPAPQEPKRASA